MGQALITVGNQSYSISLDGTRCPAGTLVRLSDGLEASFNSCECLLHLLEGVVGSRAWQAQREQIVAELVAQCPCR